MDYKIGVPSAVKRILPRKRWVIATFAETKEYSVIPTNWVLKSVDGLGNAVVKCFWPSIIANVTSDMIQDAMEPAHNWTSYRIKLKDDGKEYSDFAKAWHRQILMSEYSANEQATKRKKYEDTEDSDAVSGDEINILPQKKTLTAIAGPTHKEEPQLTKLNNFNILSHDCVYNVHMSNAQNVLMNTETCHCYNKIEETNKIENKTISVHNDLNPIENIESIQTDLIQTNESNKMMNLLNLIYKEQIQNRILYDRLITKVDNIEKNVKKLGLIKNISTATTNYDENFMLNWPMNNEQMFKNVENRLLDVSFVQQVEELFNSVGGNSVKENIKRILTKIFSNEFAMRCSWTGRGKAVSTKLCDAKIVAILKRCIQSNQSDYSEALFESVLADWFRYATTRHKRSLNA